jgi:hypothetical protein
MALYVFGIGGTGARVLKAFTLLLASGMPVANTEAVIPILIDPDTANGDLTRTIEILKRYQAVQRTSGSTNGFFGTEIKSLNELGDGGGAEDQFRFDLEGITGKRFKEFVGYEGMSRANRALASLLYSEKNLASDMEVGFKGNPHIGSVVLNRMRESDLFRKFAASVNENDRVFIISSIFGGTGAAGFPLLVKNIRNADSSLPNHARLQEMPIGAVTVLPYFDIDATGGRTVIDSNSFIAKTKDALAYYAKNLTGNSAPRLNALYYIGDNLGNTQAGADGAQEQRNKAHFIELAAALSIFDFMQADRGALKAPNGIAQAPRYFEFGLRDGMSPVQFSHFGSRSRATAAKALTQYYLFLRFFRDYYATQEDGRWAKDENEKLQRKNLNREFLSNVTTFNSFYEQWLEEMEKSGIGFRPFKRTVGEADLLKIVEGFEEKPGFLAVKGLKKYVDTLNAVVQKENKGLKPETKLLTLFSKTTAELVADRIKL